MGARFGPHLGEYMMHCHNAVHEDHEMMRAFMVGQKWLVYSPVCWRVCISTCAQPQ